eukprot:TRINITY_DN309_c0_g1_i2.p1 TRINITY_DN309_c0_g1~~TRINITY_DN309_c0_g1_i2.p1  ORF type:complete len:147 (-),score=36.39 TRINITY_DN309_c0_g1_i2:236-676(-)
MESLTVHMSSSACLSASADVVSILVPVSLPLNALNRTNWQKKINGRNVLGLRAIGREWSGSRLVTMGPDEGFRLHSPLEFPPDWETPERARMPVIIPKFSPMRTPLPGPLPADPPDPFEEEEEEEEEQKPEKEEEASPEDPEELIT